MRIVVAMSGGVDSAVAAGLMREAGHEVVGVTLQLYDHGATSGRKGACCAGQDIHDAKRVADRLGIAHYVIDAEESFKTNVIDAFADAYAEGRTPVPCIACNTSVKFGDLLTLARQLGAEALATGHYVRRLDTPAGAELHRAADPGRDQSWFLFGTTQAQLAFCRFPIGGYAAKADVRAEAARLGLPVAEKPDSQDICFVPQGSHAGIVGKRRPDALAPGEIVDEAGTVLGRHDGIARYTVGQARLTGGARDASGARLVVHRVDAATRRVTIGPRGGGSRIVRIRDVNWLIDRPAAAIRTAARLRARDALRPASLAADEAGATLELDEATLAAPGQAAVFYDGTRILGGGFIV